MYDRVYELVLEICDHKHSASQQCAHPPGGVPTSKTPQDGVKGVRDVSYHDRSDMRDRTIH